MRGGWRVRLQRVDVEVPAAVGYLLAVAISLAMLLVRDGMANLLGSGNVFLQAFPAIVCAAVIGGTGPGLVATLVSAAGVVLYIPPSVAPAVGHAVVPLLAFGAVGAFISLVTGALKESRRAARAAEHRYRELVQLAPVAVLIDFDGAIVFTNAAMRALLGATDPSELLGRATSLVHAERPAARVDGVLRETTLAAAPWVEQRWVRLDGSTVPVEIAATRVPWEDGTAIQVLVRDLTAEHDARAQQAGMLFAAETANRTKDEFLATLSHELRTPLNAVLGWTHILLGSAREPQVCRGLDVIKRNSEALQRMVEEILQLSRVVTGQLRLNIAAVELREIVGHAVETIAPTAAARGVTVRAIVPDESILVAGDGPRLQQVMWNLLANAVKFSDQGGRVRVTVAHRQRTAAIMVEDTGQGIAASFLPHVFEPFRQEDSGPRGAGGLGLGLALVRRLVEAHGGTVTAASAGPGRGATFTVVLPEATPATTDLWSAAPRQDGSASATVVH